MLAAAALLVFVAGCGKNADEPGSNSGNSASNSSSSSNSNSNSSSNSNSNSSNTSSSNNTNSSSSNNSSNSNNTSTPPKTEEKKGYEKVTVGPLKAGETAKVGPLSITLKQTNVVDKAAGLPAGYIHLMTELVVHNEAAAPYTLNITDHFKLETPEGKKAPYNIQATANRTPRLQGTVEQNKETTGWIGYLSKRVAGKYKYQFTHPDFGQATWEFAIQ